jgi:23S rRNA (uracil1939-C5)-methyltransferase
MRRHKKQNLPVMENITITDAASTGQSIAKVNELVIFVEGGVPGDIVDIQVTKKKSKYREGKVVRLVEPSPKRVKPECQHFGVCGGCKWQDLAYKEQLFYKHKQVFDNLTRIGKIELPEFYPILPSENIYYYRNKLEFSFSNKKWLTLDEINSGIEIEDRNALGFHIPKMFNKILDIQHCHLQPEPSNAIRLTTRNYALRHGLGFFDPMEQTGFLRNMIIRTSSTGEVMVIIIFLTDDKAKREGLMDHLAENFPQITSLMYVINPKRNDTINDLEVHTYKGRDFILEQMEGLKFKIGPQSFYQTNSGQAYALYKIARDFAGLTGNETVYDLYTGTGTIALFVAHQAKKVVGIEYVDAAIEDAKVNAELNGIDKTVFYAGDMKDVLTHDFVEKNGKPDVIITDPPRAGMHEDVVKRISEIEPQRIVYVSCNPATQARDLALLDEKYKVTKVQPVDMFPHTHHVENVVLLERRM